eukprot:scaffold1989_cov75-Phaeocystis_antarctica.AAC.2
MAGETVKVVRPTQSITVTHVTAPRLCANSPFRPLQPAWVGIKTRPVYHQRLRTLCEQVAICIVIEVASVWSRHDQTGAILCSHRHTHVPLCQLQRCHHRLASRAHRLEAADCSRVSVGAQPNEHLLNAALGLPKAVPAQVKHVGEGLDVGHVRSGLEEAEDGAGFRRCEVGRKAVALAVGLKAHRVAHAPGTSTHTTDASPALVRGEGGGDERDSRDLGRLSPEPISPDPKSDGIVTTDPSPASVRGIEVTGSSSSTMAAV